MNNTVDTNGFRHYLEFEGIGVTGLYEICEPIGFDVSAFVIEQASKRYGRDKKYSGLTTLTFVDRVGKLGETEQVINPQGETSKYLNYGLAWLLYGLDKYGFEFKAFYYLSKDGVFAPKQALDFTEKDLTDGYTYVKCKLIDKNEVMNLKRRMDDKFNAFGDKNVKQETITPAPSFNLLLKATPITKESKWTKTLEIPGNFQIAKDYFICFNRNIETSNIKNTLTSSYDVYYDTFGTQRAMTFAQLIAGGTSYINVPDGTCMKLLKAVKPLSKIKGNIQLKCNLRKMYNSSGTELAKLFFFLMVADEGSFHSTFYTAQDYVKVLEAGTTSITNTAYDLYIDFELDFDIPIGKTLYGGFTVDKNINLLVSSVENSSLTLIANETSIDTVIKSTRWIDLIKQAVKNVNTIPVNAELFESGGAHYNNAVFNRAMVSQKTDSFYTTAKEVFESLDEVNCDYELLEDEVYIGHHSDYYKNTEIGALQIITSEESKRYYDENAMLNKFRYGYKQYEQERTTQGTKSAIHTESEWLIQNENAENTKEVKNTFVRDPLAIQVIVDLEVTEPTTAVSEDDDVYIVEITDLPDGTLGGFSSYLNMRISDGKVQILNRDSEGEQSDVIINWLLLGFGVGDSFEITVGENVGTYTVFSITSSVLTLTPIAFTPTFSGDAFITMRYAYTDVDYTVRTTEGFALNENKFINANYSIKRNIRYYYEYLKTCTRFTQKDIINSYFKSNGAFESRLISESENVIEKASIDYDDLPNPLTTGVVYDLKLKASYNDVLSILDNYENDRGFIRCYDAKGRVLKLFPKKVKHTWADNQIELIGEEKFETEFITVAYSSGVLVVNDVVYNLNGNLDWWKLSGIGMFIAYDENNIPICNATHFSKVRLNNVVYSTNEALGNALMLL